MKLKEEREKRRAGIQACPLPLVFVWPFACSRRGESSSAWTGMGCEPSKTAQGHGTGMPCSGLWGDGGAGVRASGAQLICKMPLSAAIRATQPEHEIRNRAGAAEGYATPLALCRQQVKNLLHACQHQS